MAIFNKISAMLDMSRGGVMTVDAVKQFIDKLSEMGYSSLWIYMEDVYELPQYPKFGYLRGRYFHAELKEIDRYASEKQIEIVPCIQTLGHMAQYLRHSEADSIRATTNELLCDEPETYKFIEDCIKVMRECFKGNRLHIGMDEAEGMCSATYTKRHGFNDISTVFLRHLKRVCEICRKYDFHPIIWGDMVRKFDDQILTQFPDVDIVQWNYNCISKEQIVDVIRKLKKSGQKILSCSGVHTWGDALPNVNYAEQNIPAMAAAASEENIEEFICSIWEDDGCTCNQWFAFPGLLNQVFWNEHGRAGTADELAVLAEKYGLMDYHAMQLCSIFSVPVDTKNTYVGKHALYGDVLLNPSNITDPKNIEAYAEAAKDTEKFIIREDKWKPYYLYMQRVFQVLATKCEVFTNLRKMYKAGNMAYLEKAAKEILPTLYRQIELLTESQYIMWMDTNKPTGYQRVCLRHGGQQARVKYAIHVLEEYIAGRISIIQELEEESLPFEPFYKEGCLGQWNRLICARHLMICAD